MTPDEYQEFTQRLMGNLAQRDNVLGFVALGSMAARDYQPDRWSDHDFFVVTPPGAQEVFRADLGWLPDADDIALAFRETAHGLKVLYRSGHLLEFAVFDPDELRLAGVNRYRTLLDRADIEDRLRATASRTTEVSQPDDLALFGQFLTNLLVGVGRFCRGEHLSAAEYIKSYALGHLLRLIHRHVSAERHALLDNLNPTRRFERVYPALGAEINAILAQPTPIAARLLLTLAGQVLAHAIVDYPSEAVAVVAREIDTATDAPKAVSNL